MFLHLQWYRQCYITLLSDTWWCSYTCSDIDSAILRRRMILGDILTPAVIQTVITVIIYKQPLQRWIIKRKLICHELHRPRQGINVNSVSNLTHITATLKLAPTYVLYSPSTPPTIDFSHILLMWRIGWANKWQMGFNSVFEGLSHPHIYHWCQTLTWLTKTKIKEPPPQQHTCGRHLAQLGMTTRPQQQTIVTPGHPRTPMPQGPAPASLHN